MEFENLVCVREGRVLAVSMNRPAKLNSLSLALLRDLAAAGAHDRRRRVDSCRRPDRSRQGVLCRRGSHRPGSETGSG
jgi:hypothetical protein